MRERESIRYDVWDSDTHHLPMLEIPVGGGSLFLL
jgi:hypothetical protein